MDTKTILKILCGNSKELEEIKNKLPVFVDFLNLINTIDALPEINQSASRENLSLYQTVSRNLTMEDLKKHFTPFFGPPVKPAGEKSPFGLRFNSSAKFLGGIQTKQALFTKKLKHGEFYGSLWPWQRKINNITIHLGFSSASMSDADYAELELAVRKSLAWRVLEKIEDSIGGRIHGVSLPSFLQMSEMEKTTGTLTIQTQSNTGHLYLSAGRVIDARTDKFQGQDAAYEIISWNSPLIEIDPVCPKTKHVITLPLMSILMEGMRLKDENRLPGEGPEDGDIEISTQKVQTISTAHSNIEISTQQIQKIKSVARQKPKAPPASQKTRIKPADKNQTEAKRPRKSKTAPPVTTVASGRPPVPVAKKKKKLTVSKGILILMIVLTAGFSTWEFGVRPLQIKKEYVNTLTDIDNQPTLEEKAILLQFYINTHFQGPHTPEAAQKLEDVYRLMEDRDFDNMLMDIQHLTSSEYVTDVTAIYLQFLEKYPNSRHAQELQQKIIRLPEVAENMEYQSLRRIEQHTPEERLMAYSDFLSRHPAGKHSLDVKKRITDIHDEKFHALQKQIDLNRQQKKWAESILLCKNFMTDLKDHPRTEEVKKIIHDLFHEKDLADLKRQVDQSGTSPGALKLAYQNFLARHPDTSENKNIEKELILLEKKITQDKNWQETLSYCRDNRIEISNRLSHLKKFIQTTPSAPNMDQAKSLLAQLENQQQERSKRALADQTKKIIEAQQRARLTQQRQALQILEKQIIAKLHKSGDRFITGNDGTVTDTESGLMWCLADSHLILRGRCMTFDAACRYIERLSTGNYSDWRLPSPVELAGLYKSRPYYPASGAKWYWTSEFSVKSWNIGNNVIIFYPDIKDYYKKQGVDQNQCGAVHAVRP